MNSNSQGIGSQSDQTINGLISSEATDKAFAPDSHYEQEIENEFAKEKGNLFGKYLSHYQEPFSYPSHDKELSDIELCEDSELNRLAHKEIKFNNALWDKMEADREAEQKAQLNRTNMPNSGSNGSVLGAFSKLIDVCSGTDSHERKYNKLKQTKYLDSIAANTREGEDVLLGLTTSASIFDKKLDNFESVTKAAQESGNADSLHVTIAQREMESSYNQLVKKMNDAEELAGQGLFKVMDITKRDSYLMTVDSMSLPEKMTKARKAITEDHHAKHGDTRTDEQKQEDLEANEKLAEKIQAFLDKIGDITSMKDNENTNYTASPS